MGTYDQINKIKQEKQKIIDDLKQENESLKTELEKEKQRNSELRKEIYDLGGGKGEKHRLEKIIHTQEVEKKTLQNQVDELTGKKIISIFSKERQELINKIYSLSFTNRLFDRLAFKFKDGTENVIEIAYRIKTNMIDDMDYYTYVFRDDIVGLLEKMFYVLIQKKESSASKYLVKLKDKEYTLPKKYYQAVPALKEQKTIGNILLLINLESVGYHGSRSKEMKVNYANKEMVKYYHFLNLDSKDQLDAIFALLHFMYYFFTCDDWEHNLINVSQRWFKTI